MTQKKPPGTIAIIGTAFRIPGGASTPSIFWQLLKSPRDVIRDVPRDRFHWMSVYHPNGLQGPIKMYKGYFLNENIREFEPAFYVVVRLTSHHSFVFSWATAVRLFFCSGHWQCLLVLVKTIPCVFPQLGSSFLLSHRRARDMTHLRLPLTKRWQRSRFHCMPLQMASTDTFLPGNLFTRM
jgi:hypothetical protein